MSMFLGQGARVLPCIHPDLRAGFHAFFAGAVSFSVQLVGLYLVFAFLGLSALATY